MNSTTKNYQFATTKDGNGNKVIFATAATLAAGAAAGVAGTRIYRDIIDQLDTPEEVTDHTEVSSTAAASQPSQTQTTPSGTTAQTTPASGTAQAETVPTAESQTNPSMVSADETVNPDEVVEEILAEEQIDPNDIDLPSYINFEEIGTVYTMDGESFIAASFVDVEGNRLLMIDLDGDNVFDVITDMEGNYICDVSTPLTVDDAHICTIDAEDGYLPQIEGDDTDEFGGETIAEDILE